MQYQYDELPTWLRNFMKNEDLSTITKTIQEVESKTSAEIVPIIVRQSASYGHVFPLVFFGLGFGVLSIVIFLGIAFDIEHAGFIPLIILFALMLISLALSTFAHVKRFTTYESDRLLQVERRAMNEFYASKIHKTHGATGILIFISVVERMAVILADHNISQKVKPQTWIHIHEQLVQHLKQKKIGEGFKLAIEACGEIVIPSFPRLTSDQNELHDNLIIKN